MTEQMYALKPVFNLDARVELPTCMYSLPVIQVSKSLSTDGGQCPESVLKALEARQEAILTKLGHLRDEVSKYRKSLGLATTFSSDAMPQEVKADVVIRCSPSKPAFSLPGIVSMLSNHMTVFTSVHSHSCVPNLPGHLNNFLPACHVERGEANVKVTLIWKEVGSDCELMVSPISQSVIKGEVNIIRYFARLFPSVFIYENDRTTTAEDNLLDSVTSLLWAQPKDRQPILRPLAVNLGKSPFLCGESFGIADLALFSALKQLGLERDLQPEFRKWFTLVSAKLMGVKGRRKSRASSSRKSFGNRRPSERRKSERRPSERKASEKTPNGKKEKSPRKEVSDKQNGAKENSSKKDVKREGSPKKEVKREASPKKVLKTPGKENSPPKTVTISNHMGKAELFNYFTENGIDYDNVDHPAVFTVEEMMPHLKTVTGAITKNLFLKDKKKNLYLLSAKYDRDIKLNDIAKAIGAKELRFADESVMFEKLGVRQGCVTAYALVNDKEKSVKFVVDKELVDGSTDAVNFHPLVNTATTRISSKDFNKFLYLTRHQVIQF